MFPSGRELIERNHPRNDPKTVSIVALGCFHPVIKVQSACAHFFLNSEEAVEDSESEDEAPDLGKLAHQRQIKKKTKGLDHKIERSKKKAKKVPPLFSRLLEKGKTYTRLMRRVRCESPKKMVRTRQLPTSRRFTFCTILKALERRFSMRSINTVRLRLAEGDLPRLHHLFFRQALLAGP